MGNRSSHRIALKDPTGDVHAACGSMRKGMRHTGAVSDDVQSLMVRFKILVDVDLHIVKFDLHAIEKRIGIGGTGCDLVQSVDHLNQSV